LLLLAAFTFATPSLVAQSCPGSPGCVDQTFGIGGMNVTSAPLADDPKYNTAHDMVFQNDGKILIMGRAKDTTSTIQNVVARFTVDGQLDPTFASGGFLYIPWSAVPSGFVRKIVKQTIGGSERFILAYGDKCGTVDCVKVLRYTTTGALDTTFGTGGLATLSVSGILNTVAVQTDQKILLGRLQNPLIRLNANGSPDTSFGPNGISTFNDTGMLISAILARPDGTIITAGGYIGGQSPDLYVARFGSSGRWDASFGSQGKMVIDFAGLDDGAFALAVDANGNIVVAGRANVAGPMSAQAGWDAVIVRLTSKGNLDKKFGTNGRTAYLDIGGGEDAFQSLALQPDGKILAIGRGSLPGNAWDILVARYNANGILDPTFHGDGWNLTDVYGSGDKGNVGLIQFDPACSCNKLVVAATILTGAENLFPQYMAALRYKL
jgi:uncharacterized delta-60 repeat protein